MRLSSCLTRHLTTRDRVVPAKLTVRAFLAQWTAKLRLAQERREMAAKSVASYEQHARDYLLPAFGAMQLQRLSREDIIDAIGTWRAAKRRDRMQGLLQGRTVHKIYSTLRTALQDAVDRRLVPFNPALGIKIPKSRAVISEVDADQAFALLAFIETRRNEERWRTPAEFALRTGTRRGEFLAARWSDVDEVEGVLRIRRSVERVVEPSATAGTWRSQARRV